MNLVNTECGFLFPGAEGKREPAGIRDVAIATINANASSPFTSGEEGGCAVNRSIVGGT